MKKQMCMAVLAMALTAPLAAQTVSIYGVVDQGYRIVEMTDGATVRKTTGLHSVHSGSRIGFRADEDVGHGLKARVVIEMGITPDESSLDNPNTGLLNRQSFVEINGQFGSLSLGRQWGHIYTAQTVLDPNGNISGAGWLPSLTSTGRLDDYVLYTSPQIAGFAASVGQGLAGSEAIGNKAGDVTSVGVTFDKGPLSLRAVVEHTNGTALRVTLPGRASPTVLSNDQADRKNISYGGAYDFKAVKVLALVTESTAGNSADRGELNTVNLGLVMPLDAWSLTASVSQGEYRDSASNAVDLRGYILGAIYNLSKRTNLYVFYGEAEDQTQINPGKHETASIGIRHRF